MKTPLLFLLVFCLSMLLHGSPLHAQTTVAVPFDSDRWTTADADVSLETYKGKEALVLRQGGVFLEDAAFLNGVIDVDISFPKDRAFPGVVFRMVDADNYENFYVRPHASGNPDATQYTPVYNGVAAWQLYHGDGYTTAATFRHDEWHHLRIVVNGMTADVFLDDMETPLLKVPRLKRQPEAGMLGLTAGQAPVRYANFSYTLSGTPVEAPTPEMPAPGIVTEWQISNLVSDTLFEVEAIDEAMKNSLTWTRQQSEATGLVNLAQYVQRREGYNTVVARLDIASERAQIKPLLFGFSDVVLVFINDRIVYNGADTFQSRDERFLGTIGYFDALALPLNEGLNTVWFVVRENFGGWGVQARFLDVDGIEVR